MYGFAILALKEDVLVFLCCLLPQQASTTSIAITASKAGTAISATSAGSASMIMCFIVFHCYNRIVLRTCLAIACCLSAVHNSGYTVAQPYWRRPQHAWAGSFGPRLKCVTPTWVIGVHGEYAPTNRLTCKRQHSLSHESASARRSLFFVLQATNQ